MATENSEKSRGNARNLTPFRPGESGNPGGRPKKAAITNYIKAQLEQPIPHAMRDKLPLGFVELYGPEATFGEMLAFNMVSMAFKGDLGALKEVLDRVDGKVSQKMALAGESGGPVVFQVIRMGSK